jgi:Mn-dependent DtxR family transcriptional regulator
MTKMHTQAIEEYLNSIYAVQGKPGEIVSPSAVTERLGVAPPSVTNMLKKMAREDIHSRNDR